MIKAILFDIDGTLLNTTELIYRAFEHSLKTNGHKVLGRKKMAGTIGKSLEDCYLDFAPDGNIELLSKTHNEFQLKNPHLAEVFPDTLKTLEKLKSLGFKMAGITNRWKSSGILSIKHTGLDKYLEFVLYRDDVKELKPSPKPIFRALKMLKAQADDAVMVGDSEIDMACGKNASVKTIGVTYGFGGEHIRNFSPDFVIDSLSELPEILVY
ncbi:MAG TPA: HAD-IA family hydrolase [Patescibacteria group bacterium]|nr:HAD-IA family hydrolase [Patescibacteria group bacterium]